MVMTSCPAELIGGGLDLSDLSQASDDQLQAVGQLVWLFKEMLHDTATGGHPELQRRLTKALGESFPAPQVSSAEPSPPTGHASLADAIPVDLLGDMQRRWLPSLAAEVQSRRDGDAAPRLESAETAMAERLPAARVRSGWYLQPAELALRYRPRGHADEVAEDTLGSQGESPSQYRYDENAGCQQCLAGRLRPVVITFRRRSMYQVSQR